MLQLKVLFGMKQERFWIIHLINHLQQQDQLIVMLRNSSEKYKKMYGTVHSQISKQSQKLKIQNTLRQLEQIKNQMPLLKQMNRQTLSKKLQTLNNNKYYRTQSNYHALPSKSNLDGIVNVRKNSFYSQQMNVWKQQKIHSGSSTFNKEPSTDLEVLCRDSKDFIENLPKNSLFYCTHCCQYVFEIQKKRHHPQCKDQWNGPTKIPKDYAAWAYQKLLKIVQLAQYTSTKSSSIKQLYEGIERGEVGLVQKIEYPGKVQFFQLQEIEWAFAFTYNSLLKGRNLQLKIFACF